MALTNTAFSSANSTLTIYDNSTPAQQTAMATLQTAINSAVQLALTNPVLADENKQTAFIDYVAKFQAPTSATATITVTGGNASDLAQDAGFYYGTWTYTGGVTGTWASTKSTTTLVTVSLLVTSGVLPTGASPYTAGFAFTNLSTNTMSGTSSYSVATVASATTGVSIGKITALGDTGVTASTISAKLLNEAGTFKGKGSSDQGELSVDFLRVPADPGQILMFQAQEDMSSNANRVFCINHNNGNLRWYCIGMVSAIKTTRGAIDSIVNAKGTILIQDGAAEVSY